MNSKILAGAVIVVILAAACIAYVVQSDDNEEAPAPEVPTIPDQPDTEEPDDLRILVAYFSRTGTTERYAQTIQSLTGADIVEIETVVPYPSDYATTTDVARDELNANARPELSTVVDDMDQYDVIFVGYPIWWHAPPMAVLSFLEDYDLGGKTIVTFCTSASSPMSETTGYFEGSIGDAEFIEGIRITSSTDVGSWVESIMSQMSQ